MFKCHSQNQAFLASPNKQKHHNDDLIYNLQPDSRSLSFAYSDNLDCWDRASERLLVC